MLKHSFLSAKRMSSVLRSCGKWQDRVELTLAGDVKSKDAAKTRNGKEKRGTGNSLETSVQR